jgi:tetratricopeptide (TPR) repeat protein
LRAALEWGINGQRVEVGLRLANALWWFWSRRGYWREGYTWLDTGLTRTKSETPTRAYAMANAVTLFGQLREGKAASYFEEALQLGQTLGLKDIVAMSYVSRSFGVPDYEVAAGLFEQALSLLRQAEARFELTAALFLYCDRPRMQGNLARAEGLYQESLALARADQNRELMISPLGNLGRLAIYQGDYERAAVLLQPDSLKLLHFSLSGFNQIPRRTVFVCNKNMAVEGINYKIGSKACFTQQTQPFVAAK